MPIAPRILLVDLNNFGKYPTLSIGYLAAVLRGAACHVSVFAPLMVGVHGARREPREHRFSLLAAKLNHWAATSRHQWLRRWRDGMGRARLSGITAQHRQVLVGFKTRLLSDNPQVVMISTYLMYRELCAQICAMCRAADIPVLIGGPYFSQPEVIAEWVTLPGLSALAAGEIELDLPAVVQTLLARGDLSRHVGLFVADANGRAQGQIAAPLQTLDAVPFPDFSDFPWQAYPHRIVPVITGRGCGWGVCTFCSDVTSTAGRSYRSRSAANVLSELAQQHQRYAVTRFVFTDLKLNSQVALWRSIINGVQSVAPGAEWIGAVHVGREADNGLSLADLRAAAESGCVRLTTGLESGSQRVTELMKKGTRLEDISAFLHNAASVGISCRCTMIVGYPGETAEDVYASADFLARHSLAIERVSLNRLEIITGSVLHRQIKRAPQKFKGLHVVQENAAMAHVEHRNDVVGSAAHRRAVMRLLGEVHRVNARALSARACAFDGVM